MSIVDNMPNFSLDDKDTAFTVNQTGNLEPILINKESKELSLSNPEYNDQNKDTAINEETGEINWDCPCLKPALAPPCGEYFREAFSCFVASKVEPKGSDCLEKFAAMQECFQAHPEIYLKDLEGREDDSPGSSNVVIDKLDTQEPI